MSSNCKLLSQNYRTMLLPTSGEIYAHVSVSMLHYNLKKATGTILILVCDFFFFFFLCDDNKWVPV